MRSATIEIHRLAYDVESDWGSWLEALGAATLHRSGQAHGVLAKIYEVETGRLTMCRSIEAASMNRALVSTFSGSEPIREMLRRSGTRCVPESLDSSWINPVLYAFAPSFAPIECVSIIGRDDAGAATVLAFPSTERGEIPARLRRLGRVVCPHLGAGLRLRRAIDELRSDEKMIEARFRTDGRCIDASGAARDGDRRESLREAVLVSERSRSKIAQRGVGSAPTLDHVVDGRWSLVERFERGGQRYIVAYRNPPGVGDIRRLTLAERDIVRLAAGGLTNKEVGFSLGIRESTASTLLAAALAKLGIPSAIELPMFWRHRDGVSFSLGENADFAYYRASIGQLPDEASLTSSEDHALSSLMRGMSNDAIARKRGTSLRTVANQVASIFRKLQVHSRRELVALLEGTASPRGSA